MSAVTSSFIAVGYEAGASVDPEQIMCDFANFFSLMRWPLYTAPAEYLSYISSSETKVKRERGYDAEEIQLIDSNVRCLRSFAHAFTESLATLQPSQFTLRMCYFLLLLPGFDKLKGCIATEIRRRIQQGDSSELYIGQFLRFIAEQGIVSFSDISSLNILKQTHPRDLLSPDFRSDFPPLFPYFQACGMSKEQFFELLKEVFTQAAESYLEKALDDVSYYQPVAHGVDDHIATVAERLARIASGDEDLKKRLLETAASDPERYWKMYSALRNAFS